MNLEKTTDHLNEPTGSVHQSSDNNPGILPDTGEIIQEKNIRISLIPSKRKKTKNVNILIEGGFNVSTAGLVKEHCVKLTQYFDHMSVTLKNIEDIDLAAIQLLRALKVSPPFSEKTITIDSELSADDRSLINASGLMDFVSKK
jgi:hypothetical protein